MRRIQACIGVRVHHHVEFQTLSLVYCHDLDAVEVACYLHRQLVFFLVPKLQKIAYSGAVTALPFVDGVHEILQEHVFQHIEIVFLTNLSANIVQTTRTDVIRSVAATKMFHRHFCHRIFVIDHQFQYVDDQLHLVGSLQQHRLRRQHPDAVCDQIIRYVGTVAVGTNQNCNIFIINVLIVQIYNLL